MFVICQYFIYLILTSKCVSSAELGSQCKTSDGEGYCQKEEDCIGTGKLSVDEKCKKSGLVCCIASGVSKRMCETYARYVYSQNTGASVGVRINQENVSQCEIEGTSLVVGGVQAKPREFPHMAVIGYGETKENSTWMCGGSLISLKHVLTAAHCAQSQEKGAAKWIRMGDLNIERNDDEAQVQEFDIAEVITHPRFKAQSRYNDVTIMVLDKEVEPNGFVRPACLHYDFTEFDKGVATGWGKLSYASTNGSADLMKVTLSSISYDVCNKTYKADVGGPTLTSGVSSSQLCAGELQGGKDTCQGDSGGPLQTVLDTPHCMYSIVGVTSFGKFCGLKNSPAIYSKVSVFVPWIESVVWKN